MEQQQRNQRTSAQDAEDVDDVQHGPFPVEQLRFLTWAVLPPMELEIPLRPPPAHPEKMNLIRVSNIMGIDPKPFDPKTYVEQDVFVTDESGAKKRIRLENNIVRWRNVKKADGTKACESNARFMRWSDGNRERGS